MPVKYTNPPTNCDICQAVITETFVDGKTTSGPWGNLCVPCHKKHGIGLGTGKGQLYVKADDGTFLKTQG
jgi:hypothetical protein